MHLRYFPPPNPRVNPGCHRLQLHHCWKRIKWMLPGMVGLLGKSRAFNPLETYVVNDFDNFNSNWMFRQRCERNTDYVDKKKDKLISRKLTTFQTSSILTCFIRDRSSQCYDLHVLSSDHNWRPTFWWAFPDKVMDEVKCIRQDILCTDASWRCNYDFVCPGFVLAKSVQFSEFRLEMLVNLVFQKCNCDAIKQNESEVKKYDFGFFGTFY